MILRLAKIKRTDGLITATPIVCLVVKTADCVPIMLYDPKGRDCAIIHAGWKGPLAAITSEAVKRMIKIHGCDSAQIIAYMGPDIHKCCYRVDHDLSRFNEFAKVFGHSVAQVREAGRFLDL